MLLQSRAGAWPVPLRSGDLPVLLSLPAKVPFLVCASSVTHILGAGAEPLALAVGVGHGQQKLTPT